MRSRASISFLPFLLAVTTLHAATTNPSANFSFSSSFRVPGETLKKGNYTIQILNHLSDRVILRIEDAKGKVRATFIGVSTKDIAKPAENGSVRWANPAGKTTYIKGWSFAGTPEVIEFVYPKTEAVAIATANPAKVPAVDPASEGKVADKSLSQDDMQLLTLWVLSLQHVGPGSATSGIKAERYQLTASAEYRPAIKALPHTASFMPLVWMAGFCAMIMAFCLHEARLMRLRQLAKIAVAGKG